MIFITVGTHEQQFNRLVEYMDKWASQHDEKVVIQTGYSTYEPQCCMWKKFFPYQEMRKKVEEARIVVTHGGPSSFIMPIQFGKKPIVVPRKYRFGEHVNDHQVIFCNRVKSSMGSIIVVEDIEKLGEVLDKYDELNSGIENELEGNNAKFCKEFEKVVDDLFGR